MTVLYRPTSVLDTQEIVSRVSVLESPLAERNISSVKDFLNFYSGALLKVSYKRGDLVIETGHILNAPLELGYSEVPLGLIVSGDIVVVKDGKATKKLSSGDFIGLFEACDFIKTGKRRHIGDWSLRAFSDVEIIYFPEPALRASEQFMTYLVDLARSDPVPQPLSTMPLLDQVAAHTTHENFTDYAILCHTHFLPSNIPLFRHLAHLVGPNRLFLMDKPYSTVPSVTAELVKSGYDITPVRVEKGSPYAFAMQKSLHVLWDSVSEQYGRGSFKKLLILDDGADVWLSVPINRLPGIAIAGVEQTQRGTTRLNATSHAQFPIVSVASSGVKKVVESDFIGHSVAEKIGFSGLFTTASKVGIIGAGSIGKAVARSAIKAGSMVGIYDPTQSEHLDGIEVVPSLDSLLNNYDLIVGTSGTDSLRGVAFERVTGTKTLLSASSSDIEFGSLLKISHSEVDVFGAVSVQVHENLTITILNGGFPFNFDRQGNAVDEHDIVITRCLLYAGMMQAAAALERNSPPGVYELDRVSQAHILEEWVAEKDSRAEAVEPTFRNASTIVNATVPEPAGSLPSVWR